MLWGDGHLGNPSSDVPDETRYQAFQALSATNPTPPYVIGFEEPDCSSYGSANMPDEAAAAKTWDDNMARFKAAGSKLVSPSMCKQIDETWLTPFEQAISTPWDITNVHINKNNMDAVKAELDYYYNKYGKPIWVSEFACVSDSPSWTPCTDQSEINTFITDIVALLQADSRVAAYAISTGVGLSDAWTAVQSDGTTLTETGNTYLAAIKSAAGK